MIIVSPQIQSWSIGNNQVENSVSNFYFLQWLHHPAIDYFLVKRQNIEQ